MAAIWNWYQAEWLELWSIRVWLGVANLLVDEAMVMRYDLEGGIYCQIFVF